MLNSDQWKPDSNTQISFRNPATVTVQGNAGGLTVIGGTAAADDLTLRATSGVGAGSEAIIFQTGNNGAIEGMRLISVSGTDAKLGIGTTTAGSATRLQVDQTSTDTSGTITLQANALTLNPGASTSALFTAQTATATVTNGNAQAFTNAVRAFTGLATHRGDANVTLLQGGGYQVHTGPLLAAQDDTATATDLIGLQLQAFGNSNLTNTTDIMITRMHGAVMAVDNRGKGTVTTAVGGIFNIGIQDADAVITNAFAARFSGLSSAGVDILTAGTVTNGTMVEIGDWTSGPTYTNAPIGLRILEQTATGGIAMQIDGGLVTINEAGGDYDFRLEGDSLTHMIYTDANASTENIALLTTAVPNWQTMDRGMFIGNVTTAPTGNPTSGGFLYSNAGAGTWRGSGGTVTAFGPAGPHCGVCGYDYWTVASKNEEWKSYLYICGMCKTEYKAGPQEVHDLLTEQQKSERIYPGMSFDEVNNITT